MTNAEKTRITIGCFERYLKSTKTDLHKVYDKPSVYKQSIWDDIKREAIEKGGSDVRVVAHNGWIFTVGYIFPDQETGVLMFTYITPNWRHTIECPAWF